MMAEDQPAGHADVDEAIRRITRQLDILRSGPTLGEPSDDAQVISDLETELAVLRDRPRDPR